MTYLPRISPWTFEVPYVPNEFHWHQIIQALSMSFMGVRQHSAASIGDTLGCWLSGIDVSTQMLNQNFQDPFVAIVVDPIRTISAGKVNLGAFRTYPQGLQAPGR